MLVCFLAMLGFYLVKFWIFLWMAHYSFLSKKYSWIKYIIHSFYEPRTKGGLREKIPAAGEQRHPGPFHISSLSHADTNNLSPSHSHLRTIYLMHVFGLWVEATEENPPHRKVRNQTHNLLAINYYYCNKNVFFQFLQKKKKSWEVIHLHYSLLSLHNVSAALGLGLVL